MHQGVQECVELNIEEGLFFHDLLCLQNNISLLINCVRFGEKLGLLLVPNI